MGKLLYGFIEFVSLCHRSIVNHTPHHACLVSHPPQFSFCDDMVLLIFHRMILPSLSSRNSIPSARPQHFKHRWPHHFFVHFFPLSYHVCFCVEYWGICWETVVFWGAGYCLGQRATCQGAKSLPSWSQYQNPNAIPIVFRQLSAAEVTFLWTSERVKSNSHCLLTSWHPV